MWYNTNKKYILRGNFMEKKVASEWQKITEMLWITDRQPTLDDIEKNRCQKFIVLQFCDSYPKCAFYSNKNNKWYKHWNPSKNEWEEEVEGVLAWQFLPVANYNEIKRKSEIIEERFKKYLN